MQMTLRKLQGPGVARSKPASPLLPNSRNSTIPRAAVADGEQGVRTSESDENDVAPYSRDLDTNEIKQKLMDIYTIRTETKLDQFRPYARIGRKGRGRNVTHDVPCDVLKTLKTVLPQITLDEALAVIYTMAQDEFPGFKELVYYKTLIKRTKAMAMYRSYYNCPPRPKPKKDNNGKTIRAPPGHTWESASPEFAQTPERHAEHMQLHCKSLVAIESCYAQKNSGSEVDIIKLACQAVDIYNGLSPTTVQKYTKKLAELARIRPASGGVQEDEAGDDDDEPEAPPTASLAERNVRRKTVNQNTGDFAAAVSAGPAPIPTANNPSAESLLPSGFVPVNNNTGAERFVFHANAAPAGATLLTPPAIAPAVAKDFLSVNGKTSLPFSLFSYGYYRSQDFANIPASAPIQQQHAPFPVPASNHHNHQQQQEAGVLLPNTNASQMEHLEELMIRRDCVPTYTYNQRFSKGLHNLLVAHVQPAPKEEEEAV